MALSLAGCQRGCLSTWLREKGLTGEGTTPSPLAPAAEPSCPGGLARCVGGVVFASRTANAPCSPEGCACPWDDAGACARGCVVDGLSIEMPAENAARQLCAAPNAPLAAVPVTSAPPRDAGEDEPICDIERFRCLDGFVYACDGAPHAVARCTAGCAPGEGSLFEPMALETAVVVLCSR